MNGGLVAWFLNTLVVLVLIVRGWTNRLKKYAFFISHITCRHVIKNVSFL